MMSFDTQECGTEFGKRALECACLFNIGFEFVICSVSLLSAIKQIALCNISSPTTDITHL
jgi:hypothetical protein